MNTNASKQTEAASPRVRVADPPAASPVGDWPDLLASRLFTPPARWGWQAADTQTAVAPSVETPPPARPVWTEPPPPDTTALRAARSKAVSRLVRRVAVTVIIVFAFVSYQLVIEQNVDILGDSAREIYGVVILVAAAFLAIGMVRALGAVRYASQNIHNFEQPYQSLRAAEQERHRHAVAEWDEATRRHAAETAEAERVAAVRASGPLWFPVSPKSEPTRVDVFGGDPRRHGWASLLATFGSSVLAAGHRITLLDFTGQDVGGGLAEVAGASGIRTRRVDLDDGRSDLDLLDGADHRDLAEALGYALTGRKDLGDRREERALATDVLRHVLDSLDGIPTFGKLGAGVQVLRQGTGDERLTVEETNRLVAVHIGDIDQNEWTTRQLRLLISQLDVLCEVAPGSAPARPLWTNEAMSLIATEGGRDDRKELIDRVLVQLALRAMDRGRLGGFVIVAGGDHLGAPTLQILSEHARQAGTRLVLMIDQPQGDLESIAGTGGAVCIMKMYNHRDANIAAEFIGRGHRFVVNQVTRQVGKSFTDTGGDSFAAATNTTASQKQKWTGKPGRGTGLSDSRGHTWTGTRGWSTGDNISTSRSSSRVYELIVEPQEILGMPETAFILVDNSGQGRRVIMADGNPGICLLDRVSTTPAREVSR